MVSRTGFSPAGRVYLWSVIAAGIGVVIGSIYRMYLEPIGNQWFILAALTLISGSATVKLPATYASISISETFTFTAVLLYGPEAGTLIVALDGLVGSFWLSKRHPEFHRALFNMSAPALSAWCSAHLFFAVAGISPLVKQPSPVTVILPPLVLFALVYFGLNSWLITFVIALERRLNPLKVWKSSFGWLSLNYFGGASVAFLLVGYNRTINLGYVGAIIPLLLVLYFTFKAATGRVEDADRHVEQLNRLYLSTIETLAMAIDAKDQVTHGHIRRVQLHATVLAREVGVHDDRLLKAIEAAALLHDMGKLAVPEYILNKPGKLTPAEFEKMKLHATVGADILSAIEFPYPVVPIVRHHHENWDGTGYPAGLKGPDIPIGARILSVVDCFDALTSDRPYRPRLSDDEALSILHERRGTMYDPLVVDTFMRVHTSTPKDARRVGPTTDVLDTIAHSRHAPAATTTTITDDVSTSADEMLSVYELARALAGHVSIADSGDVIAKHLRRLIPSSLCVFFIHDHSTGDLEARHVIGEEMPLARGMRMGLGQRLSGWVAANRQTILNSDAMLDFGDIAGSSSLCVRSCLSTPLVWCDELVGVLSLYSTQVNGFNEDHVRIIETVAPHISHTLYRAIEFDRSPRRDTLTGLPDFKQFESMVQSTSNDRPSHPRHALLLIEVEDLTHINIKFGRPVGDEVLRQVAHSARGGLRVADILFRNGADDFVAFLGAADGDTAEVVAARIRERINDDVVVIASEHPLVVRVNVSTIIVPPQGAQVKELLATAKAEPQVHSQRPHDESLIH